MLALSADPATDRKKTGRDVPMFEMCDHCFDGVFCHRVHAEMQDDIHAPIQQESPGFAREIVTDMDQLADDTGLLHGVYDPVMPAADIVDTN